MCFPAVLEDRGKAGGSCWGSQGSGAAVGSKFTNPNPWSDREWGRSWLGGNKIRMTEVTAARGETRGAALGWKPWLPGQEGGTGTGTEAAGSGCNGFQAEAGFGLQCQAQPLEKPVLLSLGGFVWRHWSFPPGAAEAADFFVPAHPSAALDHGPLSSAHVSQEQISQCK